MTCKTCNREDRPETCGSKAIGEECPCCGMVLIAEADETPQDEEISEETE